MSQRSNSTLDRDHRRSLEHKVWLDLQELNTVDWETVNLDEVQDYLDILNDLESECENETLCEQINELKELLSDLID